MVEDPNVPYLLIIDTDQYSGNFERELTGFCTGVNDGTHGDVESELFDEFIEERDLNNGWEHKIVTQNQSNGFPRVCTIWPTEGRLNNGMGFHYSAGDAEAEADARAKSIESMVQYQAGQRAMCERRLAEQDFEESQGGRGWTKEACERTLKGFDEAVERAGKFVGFPAYESVAIFLNQRPDDEDLALFRERLTEFSNNMTSCGRPTGKTLTIKGVRLIKRTLVITDEEIPI